MAEQQYNESNYKFTDPVRFFKANDPYYFEVDNIPLKQLQENCLWLKDQIKREIIKITKVKRIDIEELKPYSTGGDRLVRVNPGRYTARINDASSKKPLAYLRQVLGSSIGDVDAYEAALPNAGTFNTVTEQGVNTLLRIVLETFQDSLAEDALGMNGLAERAFTWPVITPDSPIGVFGVEVSQQEDTGALGYSETTTAEGTIGAANIPMLITEALIWAKSKNSVADSVLLTTYDYTDPGNGFSYLPQTESFFVKKWRGVARTAIVDVPDELSIEVPVFDTTDFSYIDAGGEEQQVDNVTNRIDMVFIYSKPIDASSTTIIRSTGKETISTPTLGIVRGAGIKVNYKETEDYKNDYVVSTKDNNILASPSDAQNSNMGFTAASANDIAFDVRGSFPSPDDLLNIAPLLSEKLENDAFELVGQSILPVAYVWVTPDSSVVTTTDVIDIRPLFRTAELTYNERAGIAAAIPQLSLANPAVGKAQMKYELKRLYNDINSRLVFVENEGAVTPGIRTVATGYVFGGWNFGPEGALYDLQRLVNANNTNAADDSEEAIKTEVRRTMGLLQTGLSIPAYPDWDLADWTRYNEFGQFGPLGGSLLGDLGKFPNDYINVFFSEKGDESDTDASIICSSAKEKVNTDGLNDSAEYPERIKTFKVTKASDQRLATRASFAYIKKRINFDRGAYPGMVDYIIDVDFLNSVPLTSNSGHFTRDSANSSGTNYDQLGYGDEEAGRFIGNWIEKGEDHFVIYLAFAVPDQNRRASTRGIADEPFFPAPHQYRKGNSTVTASARGGDRFSSFVVLTQATQSANDAAIRTQNDIFGYRGNPRVGRCTYPTITWSMKAIDGGNRQFHYGTLNGNEPTISLDQN
tara:strand:- start:5253 stop:7850 length:2598 start_codon:yes stop_codon:yes gene_type:complete